MGESAGWDDLFEAIKPRVSSEAERARWTSRWAEWRALLVETWPSLHVSDARFVHAVLTVVRADQERAEPDSTGSDLLTSLRGDDLYLAHAALKGDPEGLRVVGGWLEEELAKALQRIRAPEHVQHDMKQLTRERLLVTHGKRPPALARYSGRGSLRGFLRITATRTALNELERLGQQGRREEGEQALLSALPSPFADPELAYLRQTYQPEFARAFVDAISSLTSEQRTLLKQHYLDRLHPGELAPLYDVHRTTVLRWLEDAHADLVRGTRRLLEKHLGASREEVESLIRMLASQLEVGLERCLANA